ncbi:branched-chain amino acid ABC transporter permease [Noviherbaspirillum cavernae]|uniref:Branched-chain amino acid ABC transporter permease n=1 Tax=Noviherbaspirillum cavernae TaxID=2320862 RepID=A0A418WW78_9BURK|nr:branched-chain amino acid ABC transporter permease [Noviherbaspirillum cavernae]RJF96950.1 branched-chain amino acid ABC transporter permease [Noviherbaspirillum cavernae]
MKNLILKDGGIAALVFFVLLALLPAVTGDALISIATLVLMFAVYGIAWNLMMGYVGQLSLGHGLYIGLGAYAVALATGTHGLSPWLGILIGAAISAVVAAVIAFIGFRFSVRGIYFTLLTIACAEMMRISFDNWSYVGGTGGYFLKAAGDTHPLLSLRGDSTFFYFAFLILTAITFLCSAALMKSKFGYFWRAIREDEDAARALGVPTLQLKILAVVISAIMTSIGGSFYALLSGSLFPDTMMGMRFSIEIVIAPIIGGLGTLFGPIVGALFVVPLGEFSNHVAQSTGIYGLNLLIHGALLLVVVCFMPEGLWPAIAKRFGRLRAPAAAKASTPATEGQ